jgi:hypothetical protein
MRLAVVSPFLDRQPTARYRTLYRRANCALPSWITGVSSFTRRNLVAQSLRYSRASSARISLVVLCQQLTTVARPALWESPPRSVLFSSVSAQSWPRLIHRRLYYKLIMFLERKIYRDTSVRLVAVSSSCCGTAEITFPTRRRHRHSRLSWFLVPMELFTLRMMTGISTRFP